MGSDGFEAAADDDVGVVEDADEVDGVALREFISFSSSSSTLVISIAERREREREKER